jgi:hypothetical protein
MLLVRLIRFAVGYDLMDESSSMVALQIISRDLFVFGGDLAKFGKILPDLVRSLLDLGKISPEGSNIDGQHSTTWRQVT